MYLHVTLSIIYIQTEMHKHRPLTCQLVHLSTRLFFARLDSGFHGSRHSHGRTRQESSVGGVLEPWQREWIRHEPRSNGRLHTFDPTRTKTARSSCSKTKSGKTLRVEAVDAPFSFSALHYSASDLYHADHDFKLPKTDYTILSIDCAVMGLGNSSCGPGVLKKYSIDKKRAHTLRLVVYE